MKIVIARDVAFIKFMKKICIKSTNTKTTTN